MGKFQDAGTFFEDGDGQAPKWGDMELYDCKVFPESQIV
jgi:hypothetical protein